MRAPKAPSCAFAVGDRVRTRYFTPGAWDAQRGQTGIPAESIVVVRDAGKARGEMARYKVEWNGGSGLWVYEDVLEAL